jgi:glycosyltransferase involved in cell wall biosynthesis
MSTAEPSLNNPDRRNRASIALSIVMPCYNEADQIEEILRAWSDSFGEELGNVEIIVVNDGSSDGTGRILDRIRKEIPALRVIHQLNGGREGAIRRGYELARGNFILQTESNGRFDPSDFVAFWEKRNAHELLLARRTKPHEGLFSRLQSSAVQSLVKFLFGADWREPQVPFRLISRACLSTQLARLPRGMHQVNLGVTLLAHADNPLSVGEVEVPFRFRSGLRRRPSLWFLLGSLFQVTVELLQLRFTLLKLRLPASPATQSV